MIPKPLYEPLPYVYILGALMVLLLADQVWVYLFAALLYAGGAAIWVMRSNYRRKTSPQMVRNRASAWLFPRLVYEFLPFVYLGIGVLILSQLSLPWSLVPGGLLCLAGALVWLIRAIYRSQSLNDEGSGGRDVKA